MYQTVKDTGDAIAVPQLVFARLDAPGGDDVRFKVALYALREGQVDPRGVAQKLRIPVVDAEKALEYWEGAGLLEKKAEAVVQAPPVEAKQRQRLTMQEVASAGESDAVLGGMLTELQRIFGGIISPGDMSVFVTLYAADGVPADLILLAAAHFASKGKYSARYLEKVLLSWRRDGIADYASAEAHLKLLAQRERREKKVATLLNLPVDTLTLAERRRIAQWYEEFGYNTKMLEAARLVAGDKHDDILYISGILRKWYGKGYRTPKDVQQNEESRNVRVQGGAQPDGKTTAPAGSGILGNVDEYVPLKQRRSAR